MALVKEDQVVTLLKPTFLASAPPLEEPAAGGQGEPRESWKRQSEESDLNQKVG